MFRSQNCPYPPALPSRAFSFSALSVNSACPKPLGVLRRTRSLTHINPPAPLPSPRHSPTAAIPFRITFFAYPYHVTPIESDSCKKQGRGWGIQGHSPTQALLLISTASKHPTHSNSRNSIPLMRLLHSFLDTPGGGVSALCHSEPSAERVFSVLWLVTSLPPYFVTSHSHGPRLPPPFQLFNPQFSTSSSTIPALHSGADFTQGDR
jgi:hypothetical protein